MPVYIYSRINKVIKIRCTLWSPQLTDEQIRVELDKEAAQYLPLVPLQKRRDQTSRRI